MALMIQRYKPPFLKKRGEKKKEKKDFRTPELKDHPQSLKGKKKTRKGNLLSLSRLRIS